MTKNAALKKLDARVVEGTDELLKALADAKLRVADEIRKTAARMQSVSDAATREKLYGRIQKHYDTVAAGIDDWTLDTMGKTAADWHGVTVQQLQDAGRDAPQFDRGRVKRYWEMISPENGSALAAVFTDQMAAADIRGLRGALVDTLRQASIEGWTAKEQHKHLQERWDTAAGNVEAYRFVDKAGREWANADYLNMLVRTTQERVARDSFVDTMAAAGMKLARIAGGPSEQCEVCAAWDGLIVLIAGEAGGKGQDYPTLEDAKAAGVFHPNCVHYPEYVDEDVDKADIEIQAETDNPKDWTDTEQVDKYSDQIDLKSYRDEGQTAAEAYRSLVGDKLEAAALRGTFDEGFAKAARNLPPEVLDKMDPQNLPRFRLALKGETPGSRQSSGGGVVAVDRRGTPAEAKAALTGLLKKQGIVKP